MCTNFWASNSLLNKVMIKNPQNSTLFVWNTVPDSYSLILYVRISDHVLWKFSAMH